MNIKAGDVVVHKLGERLLVLEVFMQPSRYLKCRRPNFDIVTIKDREILGVGTRSILGSGVKEPYRVYEFIDRLESVWQRHPQLRLGQVIGNVFNYALGKDPYNVEDEAFISALEEFYGKEGGVQ